MLWYRSGTSHTILYNQLSKCLTLQVLLGGTFKDPGCFVQSTAVGKASPTAITATISGPAALHTKLHQRECLQIL